MWNLKYFKFPNNLWPGSLALETLSRVAGKWVLNLCNFLAACCQSHNFSCIIGNWYFGEKRFWPDNAVHLSLSVFDITFIAPMRLSLIAISLDSSFLNCFYMLFLCCSFAVFYVWFDCNVLPIGAVNYNNNNNNNNPRRSVDMGFRCWNAHIHVQKGTRPSTAFSAVRTHA